MNATEIKLERIKNERIAVLRRINIAREELTELNLQRENIIMSQEE